MISKTGQNVHPSVSTCGVNIFTTLRLRDRWANVDETWQAYSMGRETQLLEAEL